MVNWNPHSPEPKLKPKPKKEATQKAAHWYYCPFCNRDTERKIRVEGTYEHWVCDCGHSDPFRTG